jgi:hypothetical protein
MPITFEVIKKLAHNRRREILHRHPIDWTASASAGEWQQQGQCIPVTDLSIRIKIAFNNQMLQQETTNPGAERASVTHGRLRIANIGRSDGWPPQAVRESFAGSAGST